MSATITGATRLYAIVGDPVAPLRTPAAFNAAFARSGRDAACVALQIPEGALAAAWPGLVAMRNLDGLVITMPHKRAVVPLLARLGRHAQLTGSVNTVRRDATGAFEGEMFDGEGFRDGLQRRAGDLAGTRVLLIGCGAAGTAIACALAAAGVAEIGLHDPAAAQAAVLAARLGAHFPALRVSLREPDPTAWQVVVNASPLGLGTGDPPPCDLGLLRPGQIVADVIPNPEVTPLIAAARALGCVTATGRDMHEGQARLAMAWLGIAEGEAAFG
jgi:shikimate dehydrogenase